MSDVDQPPDKGLLAEGLTWLFENVVGPNNKPFGLRQVADAIAELSREEDEKGVKPKTIDPISFPYIGELRAGKATRPTITHLNGLAEFWSRAVTLAHDRKFDVPVGFFTNRGVAEQVKRKIQLLATMQAIGARPVALRTATKLDPEQTLQTMLDLAEAIREELRSRRSETPDGPG